MTEPDDLDELLDAYTTEAESQLQKLKDKAENEQQRRSSKRRRGSVCEQRREAALSMALPETNKGFQMLRNMGFTPGESLGRSMPGLAEPIPLVVKIDKLGVGRENKKAKARERERRREAAEEQEAHRMREEAEVRVSEGVVQHQSRAAEQFAARRAAGLLLQAQQACETLDEAAGVARNKLWRDAAASEKPATLPEGAEVESEAEADAWRDLPAAAKLADVVQYLRKRYCYCLYCGTKYQDAADVEQHCPGPFEEDH
jgi:hypothetical protein